MVITLPSNVHVSKHPCLRAKLSLLRSKNTSARDTKTLVSEIATILGVEALAGLNVAALGTDVSPLGYAYTTETISPWSVCLVPILRSGLGMVEAVQSILPSPVSIHHLGLFRDPLSLQPVEYYNNLPFTRPSSNSSSTTRPSIPQQTSESTTYPTTTRTSPSANATPNRNPSSVDLAVILDPVIATGGTAVAAIQTLKEWGVQRIIVISVLACASGLQKVAGEWSDSTEVRVAGVDEELDDKGMIRPGMGDVGDRLFGTLGK